jgi:hypothetical protein
MDLPEHLVKARHEPLPLAHRWVRIALKEVAALRALIDTHVAELSPETPSGSYFPPGFDEQTEEYTAHLHFLLIAVDHACRASVLADPAMALPMEMALALKLMRNVREHWDQWEKEERSAAHFRRLYPKNHPWNTAVEKTPDGRLIPHLGGVVSLDDLETALIQLRDQVDAALRDATARSVVETLLDAARRAPPGSSVGVLGVLGQPGPQR